MAQAGRSGTRFIAATGILRLFETCEGKGAPVAFTWRRSWLAQQHLAASTLYRPRALLGRIPGLRFKHLTALFLSSYCDEPFEIATDAEAIQVDDSGSRLRSFMLKQQTTVKVVRADTRYGPQTNHEFETRAQIAARSSLLVPKCGERYTKQGLIFLREQMIEGRIFNVRRDKRIFCPQVVEPLTKFYEEWGVTMTPLCEAIMPLASFAAQGRLTPELQAKLSPLLAANPMAAVSLCHNDILSSNLAVSKNGVYFLDWGVSAPSLCGLDFFKIGKFYLADAGIRGRLEVQLSRLHQARLTVENMSAIQQGYSQMFHERAAFP